MSGIQMSNVGSTCQSTHLGSPLKLDAVVMYLRALESGTVHRLKGSAAKYRALELKTMLHAWKTSVGVHHSDPNPPGADLSRVLPEIIAIKDRCIPDMFTASEFDVCWMSSCANMMVQAAGVGDSETSKIGMTLAELAEKSAVGPNLDHIRKAHHWKSVLEQGVALSARPNGRKLSDRDKREWVTWNRHVAKQLVPPAEMSKLRELRIKTHNKGVLFYHGNLNNGEMPVFLSTNFALLGWKHKTYCLTRDHFLMIADVVSQRFVCQMAAELAILFGKDNYLSPIQLTHVFQWGDALLEEFGNEAYSTISLFEGRVSAAIQSLHEDQNVDNNAFLREINKQIVESQKNKTFLIMFRAYSDWVFSRVINTPDALMQAFGLYRIWGHPNVDMLGGLKKLKKIATKDRKQNPLVIRMVWCKWREYFCKNYFDSKGCYPEIEYLKGLTVQSYLLQCLKNGNPIDVRNKQYSPHHWEFIKFGQTFSIPDRFDLSEMIADKSCTNSYPNLVHDIETKGSLGDREVRSVIMKWLQNEWNDPRAFLAEIAAKGFPIDEIAVGLKDKEKELKLCPRCFGLLPIIKRLYVVLTEAMLADKIFPFFPEITMTFDQTTLWTRMRRHTKLQGSESQRSTKRDSTVVLNLDFSKWNSHMRKEETWDIFKDFDHLFGLKNCYTRTHQMFESAIMFCADGINLPEIVNSQMVPNSDTPCTGHKGGIEGLRQKGWTLFTVVILKYVMEDEGLKCEIMGQGDNQVLICKYPKTTAGGERFCHQKFMARFKEFLLLIGPPLKLEETWASSNFFIYGKYPIYLGRPLSMSMKKLCRISKMTNDGLINLESTLSSISANASAAASMDTDPWIPFFISSFESSAALKLHLHHSFYCDYDLTDKTRVKFLRVPRNGQSVRHKITYDTPTWSQFSKLSESARTTMLSYYNVLGGYPVLHLQELLMHGFSDKVPLVCSTLIAGHKAISGYTAATGRLNHALKYWLQQVPKILNPYINEEKNPVLLCKDPSALNLLHASSISDKTQRAVRDALASASFVTNSMFKSFLNRSSVGEEELSKLLFQMEPLTPRVMNSVLESTVAGRCDKTIRKISNSATTINMMLRTLDEARAAAGGGDFLLDCEFGERAPKIYSEKFGEFEANYFAGMALNLNRASPDLPEGLCADSCQRQLRKMSWGKEVFGLGPAAPSELLHIQMRPEDPLPESVDPKGGYILVKNDLYGDVANFQHEGSFMPAFGSKTISKVKNSSEHWILDAPTYLRVVLRLMTIIGWGTLRESNFSKLVQKIFSTMTDLDPSFCIPDYASISGTMTHRWPDSASDHKTTLALSWLRNTHMAFLMDNFKPQNLKAAERDNFNLDYQAIMAYVSSVWSIVHSNGGDARFIGTWKVFIKCQHCLQPIVEDMIEVPQFTENAALMAALTPEVNNPYCYVRQDQMRIFSAAVESLVDGVPEATIQRDDWEGAFISSVALQYITDHTYAHREMEVKEIYNEVPSRIDVSLCSKVPLISVIRRIILLKVIQIIFNNIHELVSHKRNVEAYIRSLLASLRLIPTVWFSGFENYLTNEDMLPLKDPRFSDILMPRGHPCTDYARSRYFEKVFVRTIDIMFFELTDFSLELQLLIQEPVLKCRMIWLSPWLLTALYQDLSGETLVDWPLIYLEVLKWKRSSYYLSYLDFPKVLGHAINPISGHPWRGKQYLRNLIGEMGIQSGDLAVVAHNPAGLAFRLGSRGHAGTARLGKPLMPLAGGLAELAKLPVSTASSGIVTNPFGGTSGELTHMQGMAWIPPVVQDPVDAWEKVRVHLTKPASTGTTAPAKLLSIVRHMISTDVIGPDQGAGKLRILCAGDGIAGFTLTMGLLFPHAQLVYNTLFESEKLPSHGVGLFQPASLYESEDVKKRVEGVQEVLEGESDLTSKITVEKMLDNYGEFDYIFCDAEGSGWESSSKFVKIVDNLCWLGLNSRCKAVVIKGYLENPVTMVAGLGVMAKYYEFFELVRTAYSGATNSEVYLMALGRRESEEPTAIVGVSHTATRHELFARIPVSLVPVALSRWDLLSNKYLLKAEPYSDRSYRELMQKMGLLKETQAKDIDLARASQFPAKIIFDYQRVYKIPQYSVSVVVIKDEFPFKITSSMAKNFLKDYMVAWLYHEMLVYPAVSKYVILANLARCMIRGRLEFYQTVSGSWAALLLSEKDEFPYKVAKPRIFTIARFEAVFLKEMMVLLATAAECTGIEAPEGFQPGYVSHKQHKWRFPVSGAREQGEENKWLPFSFVPRPYVSDTSALTPISQKNSSFAVKLDPKFKSESAGIPVLLSGSTAAVTFDEFDTDEGLDDLRDEPDFMDFAEQESLLKQLLGSEALERQVKKTLRQTGRGGVIRNTLAGSKVARRNKLMISDVRREFDIEDDLTVPKNMSWKSVDLSHSLRGYNAYDNELLNWEHTLTF